MAHALVDPPYLTSASPVCDEGTLTCGIRFYDGVNLRSLTLYAAVAALVFGCGRSSRLGTTEPERATNLDLLIEAVRKLAIDIAERAELDSGAVLVVGCQAESEQATRLVEAMVVGELQRKCNCAVYEDGTATRGEGDGDTIYHLGVTVLQLHVGYSDRRGDGFLQTATVARSARVRVAAKLTSPAGRILWADDRKADIRDRLSLADLERAEEEAPQFARGVVPDANGSFGGLMEPLIVAAAAGAVVYFFFVFRN